MAFIVSHDAFEMRKKVVLLEIFYFMILRDFKI